MVSKICKHLRKRRTKCKKIIIAIAKVRIVFSQRKSEELSSQPRVPKVKPSATKVSLAEMVKMLVMLVMVVMLLVIRMVMLVMVVMELVMVVVLVMSMVMVVVLVFGDEIMTLFPGFCWRIYRTLLFVFK